MELYAEAYQQPASISAVLGGLAFAAAAALPNAGARTSDANALDWPAKLTTGTAVASAVLHVVAAMTWSFMTADLFRAAADGQSFPPGVALMNFVASLEMIAGSVLLFVSIGASGWIASRRIGIATSVVALGGGIGLVVLILAHVGNWVKPCEPDSGDLFKRLLSLTVFPQRFRKSP